MTALRAILTAAIAATLAACGQTGQEAPPAGPPQPVEIAAPSGEYALDPNHSSVIVRATHFGLSHYTLRMTDVTGALNFNAEDPTQSTVTANVNAHSVQTQYSGQRSFNDELQNSEWLDADNHPTLSFRSTSVELTGPRSGRMTGDLTIRGATHPATFDITFNQGYRQHPMGAPLAMLGFSARGTFRRSDYDMRVLLNPAGGVGVSDEVEVLIEAEFSMPAAPTNPVN